MKDAAVRIEGLIQEYVRNSPDNSLRNEANEKAWEEPLVGYARGDDPLFSFYKSDIGAFFWTPPESILPHVSRSAPCAGRADRDQLGPPPDQSDEGR